MLPAGRTLGKVFGAEALAALYLDAYAGWKRGDRREVAPAWRIAFGARRPG